MNKPLLSVANISKAYRDGQASTQVLSGVSFELEAGQSLAIVGASGSGKSTLMHILGTLDAPDEGQVRLQDQALFDLSNAAQAQVRNQSMGFIYQFHHLLPEFSALENIAMPQMIGGRSRKSALEEAGVWLERVGLGHRASHLPSELSGGERQRVAIARALINQPKLVLADEPTGNLDDDSGETVYQLMRDLAQQSGTAFVVVTHDTQLAQRLDRMLVMQHGQLMEPELNA
ncbi:lipoprotein-releasing ABC transporter ATP-binding protein LolD [Paraferrimonas sedimenticola]|uniref:Lipoprotein-releasing system ATP-binding protein LolD n=1 Tax=Paraferrimonas sedimenticola TaxID=375674 RepID=A0AA37VSI8_9GAMM|nr:lipoprotein-releasing ABC transporter ATP-binding protein LolD [Paraferrimonas sedimenticola]GLP94884.1 lipoprotein-releasing system ATP-binding protein LolD [Paraferrimonas sedimenticola]